MRKMFAALAEEAIETYQNVATGACVDDSFTLSTENCTNSEYQRWYVYSSNSVVFDGRADSTFRMPPACTAPRKIRS